MWAATRLSQQMGRDPIPETFDPPINWFVHLFGVIGAPFLACVTAIVVTWIAGALTFTIAAGAVVLLLLIADASQGYGGVGIAVAGAAIFAIVHGLVGILSARFPMLLQFYGIIGLLGALCSIVAAVGFHWRPAVMAQQLIGPVWDTVTPSGRCLIENHLGCQDKTSHVAASVALEVVRRAAAGGNCTPLPANSSLPECVDELFIASLIHFGGPAAGLVLFLILGALVALFSLGPLGLFFCGMNVTLVTFNTGLGIWWWRTQPSQEQVQHFAVMAIIALDALSVLTNLLSYQLVGRSERFSGSLDTASIKDIGFILSMVPVFVVSSFLMLLGTLQETPAFVEAISSLRDIYSQFTVWALARTWINLACHTLECTDAGRLTVERAYCKTHWVLLLVVLNTVFCYLNLMLFSGDIIPSWQMYPESITLVISYLGGFGVFTLILSLVYNIYDGISVTLDELGTRNSAESLRTQFVSVKGIIGVLYFFAVTAKWVPVGAQNAELVAQMNCALALLLFALLQLWVWSCTPVQQAVDVKADMSVFAPVNSAGKATVVRYCPLYKDSEGKPVGLYGGEWKMMNDMFRGDGVLHPGTVVDVDKAVQVDRCWFAHVREIVRPRGYRTPGDGASTAKRQGAAERQRGGPAQPTQGWLAVLAPAAANPDPANPAPTLPEGSHVFEHDWHWEVRVALGDPPQRLDQFGSQGFLQP